RAEVAVVEQRRAAATEIDDAPPALAKQRQIAPEQRKAPAPRALRPAEPARYVADMRLVGHHPLAGEERMPLQPVQRIGQSVGRWKAAAMEADVDLEAETERLPARRGDSAIL